MKITYDKDGVMKIKISDSSTTTEKTITKALVNDTYVKLLIQFVEGPADTGELTVAIDGAKLAVYDDISNNIAEFPNTSVASQKLNDTVLASVVEAFGDGGAVNVDVDHISFGYAGGAV